MAKVVILGSDLVYYNANTHGKNVGDCVKRGLSLAYRMDYDKIASELNKIKRQVGYGAYNLQSIYFRFIRAMGDEVQNLPSGKHVTVELFAEEHPNGTWLVITAPSEDKAERGSSNHILPIINGTIYDSWDSTKQFVTKYVEVKGGPGTDLHDDIDITELANYVDTKLNDYKFKLQDKYVDIDLHIEDSRAYEQDKFTYYHSYKFNYSAGARPVYRICKTFVKINPAADFDQNAEANYKRAKQKLYDFAYEINRTCKAAQIQVHERFYGDRRLLLSLPEAIRPYVTRAETYYDSYESQNRYEFCIKPMPGDENSQWAYYIEAYSLKDVKNAVDRYLEDFTRTEF